MSASSDLIALYAANRFKAHEGIFARRHEDTTPRFHRSLIADLWRGGQHIVIIGFRGSGKSTRAEEFVAIGAVEPPEVAPWLFRNCVFIGPSEERASERLTAVTNELKTNPTIEVLYGDVIGAKDTETKLILKDGRVIQAKGRDQDMRGMKHLDWRPDLVIVDDFEDKDNVMTPEGRRRMLRRFLSEVNLACDPRCRVIVLCTIMDPDCVPLQLVKAGWKLSEYPIAAPDDRGNLSPIWPSRFPIEWVERTRSVYLSLGEPDIFDMEMMCDRVSPGNRIFKSEMLRVEPIVHTFQAKYVMIDPARTKTRGSDATGWAVWSWESNRLIVWDAGAEFLLPNEIINLAFKLAEQHQPIEVGIEDTGLNEWLSQTVRSAMVGRGSIPYRAVPASRGQDDIIRGLQHFAARGEMVFARDLPVLRDQFLAFPTGRRDAINALAYCLETRPGRLVYDGWNALTHISPVTARPGPCYLAANATRALATGVVVQLDDARVAVLGDCVAEGDPGQAVEGLLRQASLSAGVTLTVIAGPQHFDQWNNIGLVQAIRNLGVECRPGGQMAGGQEFIRKELAKLSRGNPAFSVSPSAGWTLRAFAGGYSRPLHHGVIADEPTQNQYRTLMEGLESLCGLFAWGSENAEENMAFDRVGRPYLSIVPPRERVNAQS